MKRRRLWENDENLEEVRKFLYSQDSWLNKLETEFVRQSVIRKRQKEDALSFLVSVVAIVVTVLAGWALYKQREANIKRVDALRESAEEDLKSNNDLQATIDILQAYETLEDKTIFLKPDKEKAEVQKTLHKVFYEVRERNRIQVNRGSVYDMALSPDGKKLATTGGDDTVILWDTSNGKPLDQFNTKQNAVWSVAFSPDSQLIATGGEDGTVKLWKIENNGNVKPWPNSVSPAILRWNSEQSQKLPQTVYSIAFINDVDKGKYKLATIAEDDKVRVWDISSGNMEGEIKTDQENIISLAFSAQKKLLAIVGGDNQLRLCKISFNEKKMKLCNLSSNKSYKKFATEEEDIFYSVAFNPDEKLVTGGEDGKVKLWEIDENNDVKPSKNQPNAKEIQQGTIYSLGWSSTNKLATLGVDDTVILRDSSGKQMMPIRPPERRVRNNSVAFSPDGKLLATANDDGVVQLWDSSGKRLSRIITRQGKVNSVVFSPDPKQPFIVTGGKDGTIKGWDMSGNELDEIKTQQKQVISVVFNPQNFKQLGTFGADGMFQVLDIKNSENPKFAKAEDPPIKLIETETTPAKNAMFTPDNNRVITLTKDGKVQLFQLGKGSPKPVDLLQGFRVKIKSLVLSPDGDKLAIGGDDGTVWVWDGSPTSPPDRLLQTQQGSIDALAYTSGGKLATVGEDGTLRLWDTFGNPPIEVPEQEQGIRSIAFSSNSDDSSSDSDNTKLATVGKDGTVSLWDTFGNLLKHIQTQPGVASSAAFSPDGNLLVIGGKDGTVKLLDTSGNQLDKIQLEQGVVTSLSFSSDDKLLVTLEQNNQGKTFRLVEIVTDNTHSSSNASNAKFDKSHQRQLCFDSVALSDDGKLVGVGEKGIVDGKLVGVGEKGIVKVYSGDSSSDEPNDKECSGNSLFENSEEFPTLQGAISSIALSSDGELLVTAGTDGSLRLGNTKGTEFDTISTLQGQIKSVVFSPDGRLLATIGKSIENNKTTVKLWQILKDDRKEDYTLSSFKTLENISNVAFSPDGKLLATSDENGENRKIDFWKIGGDEELFAGICNWVVDYLKNRGDGNLCEKAPDPVTEVRTSIGEKILVSTVSTLTNSHKLAVAGTKAFANGDLATAISHFNRSLDTKRKDPEALIYLNNARIGNQKSYTIAVSVPISSDPNGALEILRGVAQAQNQINQTVGIKGAKLRILIADDNNDPKIAKQIANKLAKNPDILGVVGHFTSDATLAASEIYNAEKLAAISPVSTSVKLSNKGQYTFRTVPSDAEAARALADYMVNKFPQKKAVVFYNSESEYSKSLKNEFVNSLRGRVKEFNLSDSSFDAVKSVTALLEETVLVLMPNTKLLDKAIEVVQENARRDKPLPLLAGDDVYSPKILKEVKETLKKSKAEAVDMVVAVPWHILPNLRTEFVQTSQWLWGGDVNWRTAMSYDATLALIEGLKQNPSREGVAQALRETGFTGATGEVQFSASGDRKAPKIQLVKIEPGTRSSFGYDFVPVP